MTLDFDNDPVAVETLDFVIQWETGGRRDGGYTNNPKDPGGATKWGISKRAYPNEDIAAMTKERAMQLFYRDYYIAVGALGMPPALAFFATDTAVNAGVSRTKRWVLGAVKGGWREVAAQRLFHYMLLDSIDDTFGLGWARRTVAAILKAKELEDRYGGHVAS